MPEKQLRMFDPYRPLEETLGRDFFRTVPAAPGVYTMLCAKGDILYIGQSNNLRHRLATYKNAKAGQGPRKTFRLVQKAARILWTVCPSPEAALTLEASLIRKHRPAFNRQLTWPATWFYFGLSSTTNAIHLRLCLEPRGRDGESLHGAFKGLMVGRRILKALARLYWTLEHRPVSPFAFPHEFSRRLTEWIIPAQGELSPDNASRHELLASYLSGQSSALLDFGRSWLNIPASDDDERADLSMVQQILNRDLEFLGEFFVKGPAKLWCVSPDQIASAKILSPEQQDPSFHDWAGIHVSLAKSVEKTTQQQELPFAAIPSA